MLSHWKNWIADCLGHGAQKRRRAEPRFRGQLESLESRNVLSATIGAVSFDVVAVRIEPASITVVAMAEFQPQRTEAVDFGRSGKLIDGPRISYESTQSQALFFGPPLWTRPDHWLLTPLQNKVVVVGVASYGGTAEASNFLPESGFIGNSTTNEFKPPVRARADEATETNNTATNSRGVLAITGANGPAGAADRHFRPHINFAAGNLTLPVADYSSERPTSSTPLSIKNYDAAFGGLTSDSLLLSTDAEWEHDRKLFGNTDDDLATLSEKDGQEDQAAHHSLNDRLAESLDALERERAAVDAVLAELHEIVLTERKGAAGDAEQSYDRPANSRARGVADRFFIAESMESSQTPRDTSAGGMVLLAATGEANSSAYDLAAPTATRVADRGMISLAVETPVGLYQAVDVGVRSEPPITAGNILPSEPEAKVQASASAENAPAKKSEQPS